MSSQASSEASTGGSKAGRDPFWAHAIKVNPNDSNRVRCRYCELAMSGGITRLKEHLAGKKGNCVACPKVPDAIKVQAEEALGRTQAVRDARAARLEANRAEVVVGGDDYVDDQVSSQGNFFSRLMKPKGPMDKHVQLSVEALVESKKKGKGIQSTLGDKWKKQAREDACGYIAKWIYEAGLSFNAVTLPSFDSMLQAIGKCGPGLNGPTPYELSGKFLERELARTKEDLSIFQQTCKINGCSLMTDAWTDRKGRSIMNIVVHCETGVAFWLSKNTSSDVHDGKYIFDFVDEAIGSEMGPGEENVVQVVTDNASNNMAAAKMLAMKRPSIFWTCCAAHTINLMLGDIGRIKPIKSAITMGRTITVFIYAHTFSLDLMRTFLKDSESKDIIRPGVTRFATAFLSLQSILEKKKELRAMFSSSKWEVSKLSKTEAAKRVKI